MPPTNTGAHGLGERRGKGSSMANDSAPLIFERRLGGLSPDDLTATELAGEPINQAVNE